MSDKSSFYTKPFGGDFGEFSNADDELHPAAAAEVSHYGATETQYLGFNIPEAGISSVNYLWHHSQLKTITAGNMVYQGKKNMLLACELLDWRCHMPDDIIANGISDWQLENSYKVKVLEPLKKIAIQFDDPSKDTRFDITLTAVMPPAMTANGHHFDQVMKTDGELVLRGKKHRIDGYTTRDRSWGETRSELNQPFPSMTWMNAVFSDDFAIHCHCVDHPDLDPIWKDDFTVDPERLLFGGWVWRDGELTRVVSARKKTHYNLHTLNPDKFELEMVDAKGRKYECVGITHTAGQTNTWMNVNAPMCLTEWEMNGQKGWGDCQDIQWNDFVQRYMQPA